MNNLLVFGLITTLVSTSILYTWFKSTLPCLVFGCLKKIGLKRKDEYFWTTQAPNFLSGIRELDFQNPFFWTRDDFEKFAVLHLGMLGELLMCRFCLCYHVVLWCNLFCWVICCLFSFLTPINIGALILIILAEPIIVHILFNITESTE